MSEERTTHVATETEEVEFWGDPMPLPDTTDTERPQFTLVDNGAVALLSSNENNDIPASFKKFTDRNAGREKRRAIPIMAYVGGNGGGKSLCMLHDTLPSLAEGRKVLSTVEVLDAQTGDPHPSYERLTEWPQLLEARNTDVLFDEVVGIASSREHSGLPVQVANILMQLRRRDVTLRWSAPDWLRADKVIREVTQAVTVCSGHFGVDGVRPDGSPSLWKRKRGFVWSTYSTKEFTEWSAEKKGKLKAEAVGMFWGPGSLAEASYRTLDDVSRVGEVTESGRCAHCGGRRSVPVCKCGQDH